jgi:pimeloyl-ACP methyl ester carboxylesterase
MERTENITITINGRGERLSCALRPAAGQAMLCVHGLGCAKESFAGIFSHPRFEDYYLVVPDLPGFGDSCAPPDFSYDMEGHADALLGLIAALGIHTGPVHLIAHSMGGVVALLLASAPGFQTASFVNVEGNLGSWDCGVSRKAASLSEDMEFRLVTGELRRMAARRREPGIEAWAGWSERSSPAGFIRSARSLVAWSDSGRLLPMFLALGCPKIYVYGEKNRAMPVLQKLAGVRAVGIPGSGHFPMIDNPAAFYDAVADFLAGAQGRAV